MKKKLIYFFILFFTINIAFGIDIYSDKLNIPTSYSSYHNQYITNLQNSNITVSIPTGMNIISYSSGGSVGVNQIFWINANDINYTLESNSGLIEGTVLDNNIYINGIYYDKFMFIVVPDEKVGNCKSELGHGESNWLNSNYLPANEKMSLFNLIRVFTLSSYYNEEATNATVTCVFPSYHVLVSQGNLGTVIQHNSNNITATFAWENLGMNWFRVAPLEQELTQQNINDTYNIVCGDLEYYYSSGRVTVPVECSEFEFRDSTPLLIQPTINGNKLIYSITNEEKYDIYDVEFKWKSDIGEIVTYKLDEIKAGEMILYQLSADGSGNITLVTTFTPEWFVNSLAQHSYEQSHILNYNISSNSPRIFNVILSELRQGNRVIMSDIDELNEGEYYEGRLFVEDYIGRTINADSEPTILFISPLNQSYLMNSTRILENIMGEDILTYKFDFDTSNLSVYGVWETIAKVIVNNNTIYRNDYWRLVNTTTTTLISQNTTISTTITDNTVPSIGCRLTIYNADYTTNFYEYDLFITTNESQPLNSSYTLQSFSDSQSILSHTSYEYDKVFNIPNSLDYYCVADVRYDDNNISSISSFSAVSVSSGGSGRFFTGSVVDTPELEAIITPSCQLYNINGIIFNLCWWEVYAIAMIALIVLTFIIHFKESIKNIFKFNKEIINIKDIKEF